MGDNKLNEEVVEEVIKAKLLAENVLNDETGNIIKKNLTYATLMVGLCLLTLAYVVRVFSNLLGSSIDNLTLNISTEIVGALFIFLTLGAVAKTEASRLKKMFIGWSLFFSSIFLVITGLVIQDISADRQSERTRNAAYTAIVGEIAYGSEYLFEREGYVNTSLDEVKSAANRFNRELRLSLAGDSAFRNYSYLGDTLVNLGVELAGSLLIFLLLEQAAQAIDLKRKRELELITQLNKLHAVLELKTGESLVK